jgi:hypothetical protein
MRIIFARMPKIYAPVSRQTGETAVLTPPDLQETAIYVPRRNGTKQNCAILALYSTTVAKITQTAQAAGQACLGEAEHCARLAGAAWAISKPPLFRSKAAPKPWLTLGRRRGSQHGQIADVFGFFRFPKRSLPVCPP